VKIALRIIIGLLVVAAFGVALVPLMVLLDLGDGGTGWGLCQDGVGTCENSYFAGFELIAAFIVVMFLIVALIAFAVRLLRWWERRERQHEQPTLPTR
jgi:hypothetical protein